MECVRIETINKEDIKNLNFPKEDVLTSKEDQVNRCQSVKQAMALGNLEREKVGILFLDNKGYKRVNTTIWAVTSKYVVLKESTVIPIERIVGVA